MADPNGWRDPLRPGYPRNPEQDGRHWLQNRKPGCAPQPVQWLSSGHWVWNNVAYPPDSDMVARYRYLGPCFTPQEVAAREQAAAEEMRAICARAAMVELGWNNGSVEARKAIAMQAAHTVNAIRERPIPSSDALDAMLAEARREGMEEAERIAEKAWPRAHTYASENAETYRAQDHAVSKVVAAIRARIEEIKS